MDTQPALPADRFLQGLYEDTIRSVLAALPPPIDDSPEGRGVRDAAIWALVRQLAPADREQSALVVRYIAARAYGEHCRHEANGLPSSSRQAQRLIAEANHMGQLAKQAHSALETAQSKRRRQEGSEPARAPEPAPAILPSRPVVQTTAAQPVPAPWPRPALRVIQGGLAS